MTSPPPEQRHPVVRFRKWMLVIGPRFWIAVVLGALIVVIGFLTNPDHPSIGAWVAVSTVLGTVLGVIIQVLPAPEDHKERATGAVRGLASTGDILRDASTILDQVAVDTKEQSTKTGLAAVQGNIVTAAQQLQMGMLDWDRISPGVVEAHLADRMRGRQILDRMSKELEE